MKVTCIADCQNLVGESPLWDAEEKSLYWTDINGFRIQRLVPVTGEVKSWRFSEPVCALSMTTVSGWFLVALGSKLILWSPESDERLDFARPEPDCPRNRLNDGAADPNGNYWVGSMRNSVAPDGGHLEVAGNFGSLYRVTAGGEVSVWDTAFGITNTIVWSPDHRTFYCACSLRNILYAYDYDVSDSSVRNRRVFMAGFERGLPDGSAIDAEGYLWNCRFYGSCILRVTPDGRVDRVVEMPVSNITHCAFGGPDLKKLYVTSALMGAPVAEQLAGGLFAIDLDVPGVPTGRFSVSPETILRLSAGTRSDVQ
jgi:sugar lactone lactonase YvrE